MTGFPIACQTITWGEGQNQRFPEVFAEVKSAGFAGVEIGFRHVRSLDPRELKRMLDEAGLVLAAIHVGGNLFDVGQADEEKQILDTAMEFLNVSGADLMMYSGMRVQNREQFDREFEMLNRAAEACRAQGISLLYHNHNWEFAGDAWIMRALTNDGSEELGFCPDVGWVMKGGLRIEEFLDAIKGRIGAIHFKDFATSGNAVDTVVLGEGVAPLAEAAEWVKRNTTGMWVIAEQDNADIPAPDAAAKNAEYLKKVMSGE